MSGRSTPKDEWVARVLGFRFDSEPENEPADGAGVVAEAARAELRGRTADLAPSLRRAREFAGDQFAAVQEQLAEIRRLEASGEAEQALDLMDELELELAALLPPSNVTFQKLRLRWQSAKAEVAAELKALRATVEGELQGDALAANAKRLDEVLSHLSAGLGDTLDAFGNADPGTPQRDGLKEQARTIARDYVEFLDGSPLVAHVEDNPFLPVGVRLAMIQPLQLIEIELEKGGA